VHSFFSSESVNKIRNLWKEYEKIRKSNMLLFYKQVMSGKISMMHKEKSTMSLLKKKKKELEPKRV